MSTPSIHCAALAGLVLAATGCTVDHAVSVDLDFGAEDRSEVERYVLGVYEGDICDELGVDPLLLVFTFYYETSADRRRDYQLFDPGEGRPVGELDPGAYSFVGLGLGASCVPIFAGCRFESIEEVAEVVIELSPVDGSIPFCGPLGRCDEDECTGLL